MEKLFELLTEKIHTYGVLHALLDRLWELDSWQESEGMEALAVKTRNCISELCNQYRHYLEPDPSARAAWLMFSVIWYYQALPFYFKLLVTTFLFPVISFGSMDALVMMLIGFYALELYICLQKGVRKLGVFHPRPRKINGVWIYKRKAESDWLVVVTMIVILMHFFLCAGIWERITGGV